MNNLFGLSDLMQLMDDAIKPYLIESRMTDGPIQPDLYCPRKNIEKRLRDNLQNVLATQPIWTLETFLALACGFLHGDIWEKQDELKIPSSYNPQELNVVNIYVSHSYYVLENFPKSELIFKYKNAHIFIKKSAEIFYIPGAGEPIHIEADSACILNLINQIEDIDESKPLQEILQDSILLAKFSQTISINRMEKTHEKIKEIFQKWSKLIAEKHDCISREPGAWLKIFQTYSNRPTGVQLHPFMQRVITLSHFGLDGKIVEEGLDPDIPWDIEQAAKFLSDELDEVIQPFQVLYYCRKENAFNAYIAGGKTIEKSMGLPTITEIEAAIVDGLASNDNKYHFNGLVKLFKRCEPYLPMHEQTIEVLATGNEIEISQDFPWLYRQLSLSEYLRDGTGSSIIQMKRAVTHICLNDLLFVREELQNYIMQLISERQKIKEIERPQEILLGAPKESGLALSLLFGLMFDPRVRGSVGLIFQAIKDFGTGVGKGIGDKCVKYLTDKGIDNASNDTKILIAVDDLEVFSSEEDKNISASARNLGKRGAISRNEKSAAAKKISLEKAEMLWNNGNHALRKRDIVEHIATYLKENGFLNDKEEYSPYTIADWIKPVTPEDKRKGGRPKI